MIPADTEKVQIGPWWVPAKPQFFAAWEPAQARVFVNDLLEYLRSEPMVGCYVFDLLRAYGMRLEAGEQWPDGCKQPEERKR